MMKLLSQCVISGLILSAPIQAESLKEIYLLAKDHDVKLSISKIEANIAQETIKVARAQLLPNIGLFAGYNQSYNRGKNEQTSDLPTSNPFDGQWLKIRGQGMSAGANLNISIFNYASWAALDISEKRATQAIFTYALAEQDLVLNVTRAYLDILRLRSLLDLNQREYAELEKVIKVTTPNSTSYLELTTRSYQLTTLRKLLELDWQRNLSTLSIFTGQPHRSVDSFDLSNFNPITLDQALPTYLTQVQQGNISLATALMSVEIAKESIRSAQSGHLPTLSGSLSYGYNEAQTFSDSPDSEATGHGINGGVSINLPVYTGGATSSGVKIAEHQYVIASQQAALINREISKAASDAYYTLNSTADTIGLFQKTASMAQETLDATKQSAQQGQRNTADVISALTQYYQVQNALISDQYSNIITSVAVKYLTGTLSEQDVLYIDARLYREN
ncbi:hypothetical protein DZ860_02460 [Vibrio sinensis]|uniref:TolC family protein n=1 Tax=Vibrio sinensis TaxID=2302434 RepID=A0A3A6QRN0_9VIBR|nr:TolC family protein [Vibrio sinensis]RJX75560.1 hypothetical protein DZ860_02460 [Vibrio sinensis]